MCQKILLIGSFDQATKDYFGQEKVLEVGTGAEAETVLADKRPFELLVIKNVLPDGSALDFLRKWGREKDLIGIGERVLITSFSGEIPQESWVKKLDVETLKDDDETTVMRNILRNAANGDNRVTVFFMNRLELIKTHLQKTQEALDNGLKAER